MRHIGVDIIEVSRLKSLYEKWGIRFLKKIFTEKELEICKSEKNDYYFNSLAGKYAMKEASIKVICHDEPLSLINFEILSGNKKQPIINLRGKAYEVCYEKNIQLTGSISHDGGRAIAVVMSLNLTKEVVF